MHTGSCFLTLNKNERGDRVTHHNTYFKYIYLTLTHIGAFITRKRRLYNEQKDRLPTGLTGSITIYSTVLGLKAVR